MPYIGSFFSERSNTVLIKEIRTSSSYSMLWVALTRNGGGAEIRTLGPVKVAGFQDQCFRPLSHPSRDAYWDMKPYDFKEPTT